MEKLDWMIHYVAPTVDRSKSPAYYYEPYFANIHTHGLDKYNHRELCICISIGQEKAKELLNTLGMRIVHGDVFTEGIRTDILTNDYDVQFITFDNDPTLYMILPDVNNKLPMDSDCEEPYCYQEKYAKLISDNKDASIEDY